MRPASSVAERVARSTADITISLSLRDIRTDECRLTNDD
jgi:hypothetical protein